MCTVKPYHIFSRKIWTFCRKLYNIYMEIHAYIEQIRFLTNDMSHPAINVLSFSNIEKKENDMAQKSLKWVVKRI